MDKGTAGIILAIITAIISGISIPLNKIFVVDIDASVFTAVRAIIIGVVFLFVSIWSYSRQRKKAKTKLFISKKYLAGIAIIGGAFAFLLFFSGLKLTTGGRAAFLQKTLPFYVAIFAFLFLKEKITRKYVYAMLLMLLGTLSIYATTINPAELWMNPQLGDLLVIGATILWAAENIIAKKAMNRGESNFVVTFARMFFGGLILFGVVILSGKVDVLFALSMGQITNILVSSLLLLGYVLFYYWAIKLIDVSKAAAMLLIAPVVSLILGMILLGEPAPMLQIIGSTIILLGAYLIMGKTNTLLRD